MNKAAVTILTVAVVVLIVAIAVLGVRYKNTTAQYAQTRQSEQAVRDQFNSALESIAEIQDSLNAIVPAEEKLSHISQNAEMGSNVTQTQKEQMLGAVTNLRHSIDASKNRIRDLEKGLKSSQTEVSGLRRIIDNLKRTVVEREGMIQRLNARVDSLNVTVAGLQTDVRRGEETITQQKGVIEEKRKEIGTVYYVIGNKSDLKKKGIVTEKGGVIGIGKAALVSGSFNPADFTIIDTDSTTEIAIPGKEPRILSAQSKSSYQLQPDGENQSKLVITDPQEFRKVKYLVVLVK